MKRYYFDLSDGGWEPDRIGTKLPNEAAAQREAIRFVGEMLKGEPGCLSRGQMRVDVHDEELTVRFSVAVTLTMAT